MPLLCFANFYEHGDVNLKKWEMFLRSYFFSTENPNLPSFSPKA